jgi:hypothetical protein
MNVGLIIKPPILDCQSNPLENIYILPKGYNPYILNGFGKIQFLSLGCLLESRRKYPRTIIYE